MSPHRVCLVLLLLVLPLAAQEVQPPGGQPAGQPRIVVEHPTWDFGVAPQHNELTHEFEIKNGGDAVLNLLQVNPSCGCTAVLPDKTVLQPGEVAKLKTTFKTQTFSGPITKVIMLTTNDLATPRYTLTIRGRVTPPFWTDPGEIRIGDVSKLESSSPVRYNFVVSRGLVARVEEVLVSNPLVAVTLVEGPIERQDGSQSYAYDVILTPGYPVGLLKEAITIKTDFQPLRVVTIRVSGNVLGEVKVTPRTFNLGRVKQGEGASREIMIEKKGDADLVIESVEVDAPDLFTAELETVVEGQEYRVKVCLKQEASDGYKRGGVTIRTNCAGERVHKAYFYGYVVR